MNIASFFYNQKKSQPRLRCRRCRSQRKLRRLFSFIRRPFAEEKGRWPGTKSLEHISQSCLKKDWVEGNKNVCFLVQWQAAARAIVYGCRQITQLHRFNKNGNSFNVGSAFHLETPFDQQCVTFVSFHYRQLPHIIHWF